MNWLNIHSAVLDSPEVIGSDPVDRATWLFLLRFCIGQENGGKIVGAREWKDRRWQQLCRVTLAEVERDSALWKWCENDMIIAFYPREKEKEIKTKRKAGRDRASIRWSKHSSANSSAINSATSSAHAEGNRNRKENRKEGSAIVPAELSSLPNFESAFSDFVKHRKQLKKPMTDRAKELILQKLAQRPAQSVAALEMSIVKGWQGVEWEWFDRANSETLSPGQRIQKSCVL